MIFPETSLVLSGDRFTVLYRLAAANEAEARRKAQGICLEQTVEVPQALLQDDDIRNQVVGRIESLEQTQAGRFAAAISYPIEASAFDLTQLLNVIFGNSSMQPGIRVEEVTLPDTLLRIFGGPRWGREGIRARVRASERPLLATALKPMGLSAKELANLARQFALGGIDIIKDDHGLTNQPFAPYRERVRLCAAAVNEANQKTGFNCLYVPNVTAAAPQTVERAYLAKEMGAGGMMIAPGLVGWDTLRCLAADEGLALPVFSHPALLGSFVTSPEQGISHAIVFGLLPRLAGADASIYVNYGGRFSFPREDCRGIVQATGQPMGDLRPIFPMPGGGMDLSRLPEMFNFYGRDVIFLVAGGLYGHGPDLLDSSRQFRELVETRSVSG